MIDPSKIEISGDWTGHVKIIRYFGKEIGYIRYAAGNRVEAVSFAKQRGRTLSGDAMKGHEASMLIASHEMLKSLKMWGAIDDEGNYLNVDPDSITSEGK